MELSGIGHTADGHDRGRGATLTGVYEQPTPTRRFSPVLIAFLVVLAAAAGTVGFYGARRLLGTGAASSGQTSGPTQTSNPGLSASDPAGEPDPVTTSPNTVDPVVTVPPGDGTKCPEVTSKAVQAKGLNGDLTLRLYVQARRGGVTDAEAWICENADGVLIYQGHVLTGLLDIADNSRNTLLVAEGIKGKVELTGEATWTATNPSGKTWTEYIVSYTRLLVVSKPSNKTQEYVVVRSYPQA